MLSAFTKKSGRETVVTLKGSIDESSGRVLMDLLDRLSAGDISFDCAGIETINSVGQRQWVQFLKSLDKKASFRFVNCPTIFVEFASLLIVTAFAERIDSVLVPYKCDSCPTTDTMTYEVDALEEDDEFESGTCPKCNGIMKPQVAASELLSYRQGLGS